MALALNHQTGNRSSHLRLVRLARSHPLDNAIFLGTVLILLLIKLEEFSPVVEANGGVFGLHEKHAPLIQELFLVLDATLFSKLPPQTDSLAPLKDHPLQELPDVML